MSAGLSLWDKIQGVVGAFGCVASGALIAFAPIESLRAEIPFYFELGLGFIGFGLLFFLALFLVRAKSLILFIVTALIAGLTGFGALGAGPQSWEFYAFGLLSILIGIFSLSCLYAVFSGEDPAA